MSISDNISFNSSSSSVYSAEELIIQQRGRRSPRKKCQNDQHNLSLLKPTTQQYLSSIDSFVDIKRTSMRSPDAKEINSQHQQHLQSPQTTSDLDSLVNDTSHYSSSSSPGNYSASGGCCRRVSKRNPNKSLIRTPVKRRLRLRRNPDSCMKKLRRRF